MNKYSQEIKKIREFAQKQVLKPEEYVRHNIRILITLLALLISHVILSFITPLFPWWLATLSILINGSIMYYYFIITVHEGSHDLVFVTKDARRQKRIRKMMPAFSFLAGFPGFTIYTRDHMLHHAYLSEKKDPQNSAHLNFRKLLAYYFVRERPKFSWKDTLRNTSIPIFLVAGALKFLHVYILILASGFWGFVIGILLPLGVAVVLNTIRISFRHYNLGSYPKDLRSRSYTFLGSSIIGPGGLRYHFEHHLNANIPSYRLKNVYDWVQKNGSKELLKIIHYKKFYWKDFW